MWLHAPNINCIHGFSTRSGGISPTPYNSLNLGGSDDTSENINKNRELALKELGLATADLSLLKQVHGNRVCIAKRGKQEGDSQVTTEAGLVLVIGVADCYPILFYDEHNKVAGAAHAGWRGTLSGITSNTVREMEKLGAKRDHIKVAIGQGICRNNFEVGPEVLEAFKKAGFPENCFSANKLDLVECNLFILRQNNILDKNMWAMNRCSFENEFFSHRRDKGKTSRMWGLIVMP
jgi:YfiH family protein